METGRVNPNQRLQDQGITGLGNVYYNMLEPSLMEEALKLVDYALECQEADLTVAELRDASLGKRQACICLVRTCFFPKLASLSFATVRSASWHSSA